LVENAAELCSNVSVNGNIFIALGTNMGDREGNLLRAVAEVGRLPGTRLTGLSSFYDTEPVGHVDQPAFLNAVARLESMFLPGELLERLLRIESECFHRRREIAWGPRTMDIDLLFYGSLIINEPPELVLPHPRMHLRRFVLEPLAEIAAEFIHPVSGLSIAQLLAELPPGERVTRLRGF
ncbi:MAG TPA: 2-amino-4-hydroxy-6-hydroxymethyldihydropteridine diphosphokinase, partial [Geobacteraceae bacterium]|nr:2-amino-4-hydroxy-6-hydroxymethyldihydropteridine diphosphokinase [Geobacteraceae bacterium]